MLIIAIIYVMIPMFPFEAVERKFRIEATSNIAIFPPVNIPPMKPYRSTKTVSIPSVLKQSLLQLQSASPSLKLSVKAS